MALGDPSEPDDFIAYCDGDCGRRWAYPSEIWTCMDDGGHFQFDDGCYHKLMDGTLNQPTKLCDKTHSFYYIPKRDRDYLARIPKGSVQIGDEVVTLEAWKAALKAKYVDFDVVDSPEIST